MSLDALRKMFGFFIAPLVPLAAAAGLAFAIDLPDAQFSWPWAIEVTVLSALLVGLPAISVLSRRRQTSLRAFVAVGSALSAVSAILGIVAVVQIDRLEQAPSGYNPMESGVSWYGPPVLIFMVFAYAACGALAATAYWLVARPDRR